MALSLILISTCCFSIVTALVIPYRQEEFPALPGRLPWEVSLEKLENGATQDPACTCMNWADVYMKHGVKCGQAMELSHTFTRHYNTILAHNVINSDERDRR